MTEAEVRQKLNEETECLVNMTRCFDSLVREHNLTGADDEQQFVLDTLVNLFPCYEPDNLRHFIRSVFA